mgnify:CR=1 FL=1
MITPKAPVTSSAPQVDPAALELAARPNSLGRYGQFGGQYVPETLIPAFVTMLATLELKSPDADAAGLAVGLAAGMIGNAVVSSNW